MNRRYRLRDTRSFTRVRRAGRCRRGLGLVMCCQANCLPHSRFGFVVSKRVGNAVTRNRVKRRLRAIFHNHLPQIRTGFDIVVICRPQVADSTYQDLEQTCMHLVARLSLYASRSSAATAMGSS